MEALKGNAGEKTLIIRKINMREREKHNTALRERRDK